MTFALRRRTLLRGLPLLAGAGLWPAARAQDSAPALTFPPLLDARAQGNRVELVAQPGRTAFAAGLPSETAGYNGAYLGPTLRLHAGDDVSFTVHNRLSEETTVHWHGLLVPAEVDGGPHNAIVPGATWRPRVPVRQAAATAWYHAHPHMRTGAQVYAGLAGMLIVTDAQEQALGLPSRYGVDDLPLVLQDKLLDREGRLAYPRNHMVSMHGLQGNVVLVNGRQRPVARVPQGPVRLRLLNASNARVYDLALEDGRELQWIATEGGLLRQPVALPRLSLAPGQRAEVLLDFSDGRAARLVDLVPAGGGTVRARPVMHFAVATEAAARRAPLPVRLADWDTPPVQGAQRRQLVLTSGMARMGSGGRADMHGMHGMHSIDGKPFDMARIDQQVRLGATEVWEIVPRGMRMLHPFHIHGVHFEVLRRGGRPPVAEDLGRRDTVIVDEPVELLVQFTQAAGPGAPFMYHCHILEHEDMGMMGQFTVT